MKNFSFKKLKKIKEKLEKFKMESVEEGRFLDAENAK